MREFETNEEVSIRTDIKAGDDNGSQMGSGTATGGNGQIGSGNAFSNGQMGSGS